MLSGMKIKDKDKHFNTIIMKNTTFRYMEKNQLCSQSFLMSLLCHATSIKCFDNKTKQKIPFFLASFVKQKCKIPPKTNLYDMQYQWNLDSSLLALKCFPLKVFDSSGVFAWEIGLCYLDWHNSTAVANSELHINENIQIKPRPPRSSQSEKHSTWFLTPLFSKNISVIN